LELDVAEKCYLMCKNVGMVDTIRSIKHETDKFVIMGHVAAILHKTELAQERFLKSSKP